MKVRCRKCKEEFDVNLRLGKVAIVGTFTFIHLRSQGGCGRETKWVWLNEDCSKLKRSNAESENKQVAQLEPIVV